MCRYEIITHPVVANCEVFPSQPQRTRPQNLGRLKTEPASAPKNEGGSKVPELKIEPVNALKMEMVDTRKFGTRRAENPARVAGCNFARGWGSVLFRPMSSRQRWAADAYPSIRPGHAGRSSAEFRQGSV